MHIYIHMRAFACSSCKCKCKCNRAWRMRAVSTPEHALQIGQPRAAGFCLHRHSCYLDRLPIVAVRIIARPLRASGRSQTLVSCTRYIRRPAADPRSQHIPGVGSIASCRPDRNQTMPQSLAGDYIEHIYVMGGTPPSLQETLKFQEPSAALRQLQEMLEGPCKPGADAFALGRDYTFGARCDAQLDLLEAQLDAAGQQRADALLDYGPSAHWAEGLAAPELEEDEFGPQTIEVEDGGRQRNALPTPGVSLVEQLQLDQPLMQVITHKHKRGYYRCTHCPQTFSNIFDYAAHMDEFDIKREFKCPFALCPWKILGLPRRPDLRRHCAIQHKHELPEDLKEFLNLSDETYPALKCPHQYCDKVFHRRDAYNRHISIVHEKLGSRFNKRLFQILAECPYDKETDRQTFVRSKMRSRKSHCNSRKTAT